MPKRYPKIAIITPTYQRDLSIIQRCINSTLNQTYSNFTHYIRSDGGREKDVQNLISKLKDKRLRYSFETKHHNNYGNTLRNNLVQNIKADYIVFLDDDNVIFSRYLETMLHFLSLPDAYKRNIAFAICRIVHWGPLPKHLSPAPNILRGIPPIKSNIDLLQVMVRADAIKKIGFDTKNGYFADGITFEKLAKRYNYIEVPEVLAEHL
jgi:glycosyltransferase involved in cell wall biosynthesis